MFGKKEKEKENFGARENLKVFIGVSLRASLSNGERLCELGFFSRP